MREIWVDRHEGVRLAGLLADGRLTDLLAHPDDRPVVTGAVFLGRVLRIDRTAGGTFVDLGLDAAGWLPLADRQTGPGLTPPEAGTAIIVQAATEPRDGKGPRLTRDIALPGLFLVCLPLGDGVAVSKSLAGTPPETFAPALAGLLPCGWIVRSAAHVTPPAALQAEAARLTGLWQAIATKARSAGAPAMLAPGPPPAHRLILDAADVSAVRVGPADMARALQRRLAAAFPDMAGRLHHEETDLVDRVLPLLGPTVALPSGGWLAVEPTTALTAVDVNAGAGRDPLRTNLEAAAAVAAQLRLRNIGGTVVIDFIDLRGAKARGQVLAALKAALAGDPVRVRTGRGFSELGLVELARERRGFALHEALPS
jgi:ribonuclease E/ribonuclease G